MLLATTMRDALANKYDDEINAGASAPTILARSSAPATLNTFTLETPSAFGASSGGEITLGGVPITSVYNAAGTIHDFVITDGDGNIESTCGANTTGTPDVTVSSLTINADETMNLTALTITVDAGSVDSD